MKKIKNLWNNNRILLVLATIVIICFIIIAVVCFNYFFGSSSSKYGNRLENISEIPLKDEDKEQIISKLKENDTVTDVQVHTQGKIIYIRIAFTNVTVERAKEIAKSSLEMFNEDYQKNYDLHYTLVCEAKENQAGFTIMGAKNINRTIIIWNNNNPVEESTKE